jgi:hypothetical protein
MTSYQDVYEFIREESVTLLIVVVFMFTIIRLIDFGFKHLNKKLGVKQHDKLQDLRTDVSEQVQDLIDTFLARSHGYRVQVMEFSNTVMSVAYLPFKYMTCTYESYSPGYLATGQKLDSLSTSLFTPFFKELQRNEYCILDVNDKKKEIGGAVFDMLAEQDAQRSLCAMMYTLKGKALGYIAFKKEEDFNQGDIDGVLSLAKQVSALLSVVEK